MDKSRNTPPNIGHFPQIREAVNFASPGVVTTQWGREGFVRLTTGDRLSERFWTFAAALVAMLAGLCAPAAAQDFSAGKTPAQLFASDCSACHRSPAGLAKGQSAGALASFLREHYTTKPESASALAAYVAGAGPGSARVSPQAPITGTGPKPGEEKPAPKPRPATATTAVEPARPAEGDAGASAAPREGARPPVDPVVAKLNFYAAARGEPKDTARLALPANKLESYANSGTGAEAIAPDESKRKPADKKKDAAAASTGATAAPHPPPRPRRAQAPAIQPVPDRQ